MKTLIYLSIFALCLLTTVSAYSTAWPEICRVMSKYTDCTDAQYRVVCAYYGNCSNACTGLGMTYQSQTGYCSGIVIDAEHTWPYAQEMCNWYNGALFIVKDSASSTTLGNMVSSSTFSRTNIHVGGFLFGTNQDWMYVDGTLNANDYWSSSKPVESSNYCMYTKTSDYRQFGEGCTSNYGYACEGAPVIYPYP